MHYSYIFIHYKGICCLSSSNQFYFYLWIIRTVWTRLNWTFTFGTLENTNRSFFSIYVPFYNTLFLLLSINSIQERTIAIRFFFPDYEPRSYRSEIFSFIEDVLMNQFIHSSGNRSILLSPSLCYKLYKSVIWLWCLVAYLLIQSVINACADCNFVDWNLRVLVVVVVVVILLGCRLYSAGSLPCCFCWCLFLPIARQWGMVQIVSLIL
jgi:hypothetical protein